MSYMDLFGYRIFSKNSPKRLVRFSQRRKFGSMPLRLTSAIWQRVAVGAPYASHPYLGGKGDDAEVFLDWEDGISGLSFSG